MSTYAVVIENAGPNYSAYVPDLPGCVSVGSTVDEVTANIHEAIELYIAASIEFGDDVPAPSSQVVLVHVVS
jgi:predicted RNase H-like HicB family nuclease